MMYDILIKNGTVADGTGAPARPADVAVKDGLVAAIAPHIAGAAAEVIDAEGLIVSPGFVDSHTHTDMVALLGTDGYNYLEQGVTTQVTGQCGMSIAPYYKGIWSDLRPMMRDGQYENLSKICATCESFMAYASQLHFGTNLAFYVGHGSIRGRVMGCSDAKPTPAQLAQMQQELRSAMACGYLGMSAGLVYTPSVYGDTDELAALASALAPFGGRYVSHIRGEGDTVKDAVAEAIEIGRRAGVTAIISHLKVEGRRNEGASRALLKMIDEANAAGYRVYADQYPFTAGGASLLSQLPPKFAAEGNDALLRRLQSREFRAEVERAIFQCPREFESGIYAAGYEGCLVLEAPGDPDAVGKTLSQLAAERGMTPIDLTCRLLTDTNGLASCAFLCQNESDMHRILAHPMVMCGSDSADRLFTADPEQSGGDHPRSTGTMVRRLELQRNLGLASLEESVRRITSLPAEANGLGGVGRLRKGLRADVCVFDYAHLRCHADLMKPYRRSEGIVHVLVGGRIALRDGQTTGIKNGRLLKHEH